MISRFAILPIKDDAWLAAVSHHWNLDRDDPVLRSRGGVGSPACGDAAWRRVGV